MLDKFVPIFSNFFKDSNNIEISLFRIGLVSFFLVHYIGLSFDLYHYYGPESMIELELIKKIPLSFLFPLWREAYITICFVFLIIFFILFGMGLLPKWLFPLLFLLQISFHNANNLIIFEPHKLGNILLFFFLFLPKHTHPFIKNNLSWLSDKKPIDHWVKNLIIFFLGAYYLIGGWRKVYELGISEETYLISFFQDKSSIGQFWDSITILYQFLFLGLVFTKYRHFLIFFGISLHFIVDSLLGFQQASLLFYIWYLILLDRNTLESIRALYKRIKT